AIDQAEQAEPEAEQLDGQGHALTRNVTAHGTRNAPNGMATRPRARRSAQRNAPLRWSGQAVLERACGALFLQATFGARRSRTSSPRHSVRSPLRAESLCAAD